MTAHEDAPFAAVADATRRAILDLLLIHGDMTAGQLAAAFPYMSRPAVSKHVKVLKVAGLVTEQVVGREHHYRLDPQPIRVMYEQWFHRYGQFWEDRLVALKDFVENQEAGR